MTGIFTVKNPSFEVSGSKLDASGVGLDIPEFTGTIHIGLSGPFESVIDGEPSIFRLGLTVDPPPDVLFGFEASFDDSESGFRSVSRAPLPQAPGDGDIQLLFNLCAGGTLLGSVCSGDFYELLLDDTGPRSGAVRFRTPTNVVDIQMTFTLRNFASFHGITTGVNTPAPEAGTLLLLGPALLAVGALRKRFPKHR